jgi:putative membrane protein
MMLVASASACLASARARAPARQRPSGGRPVPEIFARNPRLRTAVGPRPRAPRVAAASGDGAVECDVPSSWADPGLNRSLLAEPECLSVARRFTRDDEWVAYQSPKRYWEQMTTINGSVVAKRVTGPAIALALWSIAVCFVVRRFPVLSQLTHAAPFVGVVGGAMTLLLAFRTNAAYARFGAAADSFAEVLAATRNLSRKMVVWCPVDDRERNARLVAAIPWAVKHRGQGIEGTPGAREELGTTLLDAELDAMDLGTNVPMQIMTEITRGLDRMNERKVELIYQLLMDNDLTALHSQAGRTDRLASTPTPVSYSRHISRGLILWLLALPATVAATCPAWIIAPGTLLVAWLLLGIDDIGMQLEQPYTVMPVRTFCEECAAEVSAEMTESAWTPRIGAPREDVLDSDFLNSELTAFDRAPRRGSENRTSLERATTGLDSAG